VNASPEVAEAASDLSRSVSRLAQTACSLVHARLDDADDVINAESRRRLWLLISLGGLLLCSSAAALFTGVAIIAAYWDTHRVLATAGVAAGFLVFAVVAALVLRAKWRQRPSLLDWLLRLYSILAGQQQRRSP
jgi:uncharacterized membrane protein YqjE